MTDIYIDFYISTLWDSLISIIKEDKTQNSLVVIAILKFTVLLSKIRRLLSFSYSGGKLSEPTVDNSMCRLWDNRAHDFVFRVHPPLNFQFQTMI